MRKLSKKPSKTAPEQPSEDALERYDWSKATRGRYAGKLKMGTPMRQPDEDLVDAFPNSEAVNDALRAMLALSSVLHVIAGRRRT